MPYGYNPAQFIKDFSGLERGLTSAISKAGIAIGDYVQTVSDNKAMDELKNGLVDAYTQQRVDILKEDEGKAKMNATRIFQPRLKGESNESLFRRWEVAGKNAKQQLATQRQKMVTKQTTEAKGGGFFPAGQGTQISGPPVQGPLQPGQEKIPSQAEQMGLRTPALKPQAFTGPRETQEGIASSLAARSTMQGQPQPTMSELKEQPAFTTAPTQAQQLAQEKEQRIQKQQQIANERKERQTRIRERSNEIREVSAGIAGGRLNVARLGNLDKRVDKLDEAIADIHEEISFEEGLLKEVQNKELIKTLKDKLKEAEDQRKFITRMRDLQRKETFRQVEKKAKDELEQEAKGKGGPIPPPETPTQRESRYRIKSVRKTK